jgi:hypothetical protein
MSLAVFIVFGVEGVESWQKCSIELCKSFNNHNDVEVAAAQ